MFQRVTENDYKAIAAIIGDEERVLFAETIHEEYSHDELSNEHIYPDIVVRVQSAAI